MLHLQFLPLSNVPDELMADFIDFASLFQSLPGNYIILRPDTPRFTIIAYNETRATQTFTKQEHIGQGIFDAFPDNPDDPTANGVAMLTASLETVLREKRPHQMAVQKYDIPKADGRGFEVRYWLPKNIPVLNENGEVAYIIHHVQDMTAQIMAEQRENNARLGFETFFDQAVSPFAFIMGRELLVTYANPAYTELMSNRQLRGKKIDEAMPELQGQFFIEKLREVYNTGISYHATDVPATAIFNYANEPTTRYFNLSYTPFKNEQGLVEGILAYASDVTEQLELRKRDEANHLSQQAYNLFMQAPLGICIVKGENHVIILANKPCLDIWGKDESIIGKSAIEALPEIKDQGFIELLDSVKKTKKPYYAYEHHATMVRDGKATEIYLNFVYEPYYEPDGFVSGVMAIATDVTEQVLARKQIEYAEETTRLAIDSAELGAYEINLVTNEMITSPRFREIWGIAQPTSRGEFAAALHDDDKPVRIRAHEESVKTGKLFYEARVIWKDESVHWIRVNGTLLYDVHRQPTRLLGVIQDITETRAFAEEMKRLVKERTSDLQSANNQLENSNRELEQFAYITSHDLQEPLRKIQVFNSLLKDNSNLTGASLTYAEKIASSAKRMTGLISDLLEYSRLSEFESPFINVDLNEILKQIISDFELLITQKGATVHYHDLANIQAIPLQMNQLFYNLIGNALKFSKNDVPPVITIEGRVMNDEAKQEYPQLSKDISYYEIIITDNGIGFDQEYAAKIFTVFQRLNHQSDYTGYGIGLALCNKIVSRHNGLIKAEGVVGEGAAFTVILPLKQAQ